MSSRVDTNSKEFCKICYIEQLGILRVLYRGGPGGASSWHHLVVEPLSFQSSLIGRRGEVRLVGNRCSEPPRNDLFSRRGVIRFINSRRKVKREGIHKQRTYFKCVTETKIEACPSVSVFTMFTI